MSEHNWVKIQITPVHVVSDAAISEDPVVFTSDDDEIEAAENVQYGCLKCDEALTAKTVNTQCVVPEDIPIDQVSQEE